MKKYGVIIRNIIKYTIGFPILFSVTLSFIFGEILFIIIFDEERIFIEGIKEIWKPFRRKK